MSNFDTKNIGYQVGFRGYNFADLKNFMFQFEYNNVPKNLYTSTNRRLNYSQYNLPLAHTKGSGFQEFIIRANYEFNYLYVDVKINLYQLDGFQSGSLLAINKKNKIQSGTSQQEQIEFGVRLNRKMNIVLFGSYLFRQESLENSYMTKFLNFGFKTALINHYNDF